MTVAIIQNHVINGGRLMWISGMIAYLNARNITPDLISYHCPFTAADIKARFGYEVRFNLVHLKKPAIPTTQEMEIILFNLHARKVLKRYDLVFNSSNSWLGLSAYRQIVHYVHFPRKYRLWHDIHDDGTGTEKQRWYRPIHDNMMRLLYAACDREAPGRIVANSRFTAGKIKATWSSAQPQTIYPAMSGTMRQETLERWKKRSNDFVTLGRFSPEKGQLKLMRAIAGLPATFHFIGFSDPDSPYLRACQDFSRHHDNIRIHANIGNDEKEQVLATSRYYIHTTINEPYGLAIIEALSHGVLPVIHASGGAREIIPDEQLQYRNLTELATNIEDLISEDTSKQYRRLYDLQSRSQKLFAPEVINAQWNALLNLPANKTVSDNTHEIT